MNEPRQMRLLYGHCLDDRNHPAARMVHHIAAQLGHLGIAVRVHEPEVRPAAPARPASGTAPRGKLQFVRDKLWFARTLAHDRAAFASDVKAIRAFAPDVVLARHDAYRGSLVRAAHALKVPVVVYADAPVAHETRHWRDRETPAGRRFHPPGVVERYEKNHLKRASAIIAVSEPGRDVIRQYGLNVPVHVIRNGVGNEFLEPLPTPAERERARRELGLTTTHVAGFVGTFKPFHGVDMLGEIIRQTKDRPCLSWLLVGDGPCKAGLMQSLGDTAGRVVDMGSQPAARLPHLYRLMDVAVAPYPESPHAFHFCPLKILEAQASGAVVAASARGDIPALLGDGRFGVPVRRDTVGRWVRSIDSLLLDSAGRVAIARQARNLIRESRTWAHSAQGLQEILDRLCKGTPASRGKTELSGVT